MFNSRDITSMCRRGFGRRNTISFVLEVLTIMYGKKQVTFDVEKLNYWPFRLSYINVKKYLETNWSDLVRPFTTIDKLSIEKYLTTASEG